MKSQYRCVQDANKKLEARRQSIPFYEELSHLLTIDRAVTTPHMSGTTGEQEELLSGTPLKEEVQKVPRMMG